MFHWNSQKEPRGLWGGRSRPTTPRLFSAWRERVTQGEEAGDGVGHGGGGGPFHSPPVSLGPDRSRLAAGHPWVSNTAAEWPVPRVRLPHVPSDAPDPPFLSGDLPWTGIRRKGGVSPSPSPRVQRTVGYRGRRVRASHILQADAVRADVGERPRIGSVPAPLTPHPQNRISQVQQLTPLEARPVWRESPCRKRNG